MEILKLNNTTTKHLTKINMEIVITIGDFKVELSDTSGREIYHMVPDIKEIITSVVNDYNSIPKID